MPAKSDPMPKAPKQDSSGPVSDAADPDFVTIAEAGARPR